MTPRCKRCAGRSRQEYSSTVAPKSESAVPSPQVLRPPYFETAPDTRYPDLVTLENFVQCGKVRR